MALVDVLEWMPNAHPKRPLVLGVLNRLAAAVASVQDPATGVFWQVLDAGARGRNYREASATAMFVYALSKAANNAWIDANRYEPVAARAYQGMLQHFIRVDANGRVNLVGTCKVAGLGGDPYRDGSFEYYTAGTELEENDPKGVGALILAAVERAKDTQ
jgi:unsaturated rhamnogalacturonyl hydrolase